jgi:glutathione S-transferase
MSTVQIIGRSSSHFTRVTRVFALELGVPFELVPILDMSLLDADAYVGNPALKLPTMRRAGSLVFGAENICRALAEMSDATPRIVWPEQLRDDISRNAQAMVWHGMAAQVQLIIGTRVAKLPADNLYFVKAQAGFAGSLRWLEDHLAAALAALPARDLSLFEVTLFCLMEHLGFRTMVPLEPYPSLVQFAKTYGARPSAVSTPYQIDT